VCHVSVGHVARALEESGIATVVVYIRAFRHLAAAMTIPRTLVTPHLMGRTMGPPGAIETHRQVLEVALRLTESATSAGTIVDVTPPMPGPSQSR
jgi:hypothetical protein